jgi:hypothetical protein
MRDSRVDKPETQLVKVSHPHQVRQPVAAVTPLCEALNSSADDCSVAAGRASFW